MIILWGKVQHLSSHGAARELDTGKAWRIRVILLASRREVGGRFPRILW